MSFEILTSFIEGINNIDSGADEETAAILALSSSSLVWRDLGNAFFSFK